MHLSFDEHPDFFTFLGQSSIPGSSRSKVTLQDLMRSSQQYIERYLSRLSRLDRDIASLYYIDGLSQEQICSLFGISQAAVSRRLKFIIKRLKFLFRMPSQSLEQVRTDFQEIFDEDLFEFAFFFYWEFAQNRIRFFIETSQSGASNKSRQVLAHLEKISTSPVDEEDAVAVHKKLTALMYLDYFRFIREKSNVITFLYKRNDGDRAGSLRRGASIL